MNFIALAACFMLIFCHGPRHHKHAPRPQSNVVQQQDDTRDCDKITKGFDSWGNSDDWVSKFPVDQQHHALVCLDKLAKRQGKQ